jgi:DNA-binding transcriptional MerR regulator
MAKQAKIDKKHLLRVGELAKAVGKTVRAIHLYEELGLVRPAARTEGRFRLYEEDAVARISWIIKLQAIGFTLSEIQGFVQEFEESPSGREAASHVRETFSRKRAEIRDQITQLQVIENDLQEALEYLDACETCSPSLAPVECCSCDQQGHEPGEAPQLFAGLSKTAAEDFDVSLEKLRKSEG